MDKGISMTGMIVESGKLTEKNVGVYQQKWEARSSVRTRPEKYIDFNLNGYFFPSDKQPILLSAEVKSLGESVKKEILLQSFFKYLHDIVHLEVKLINSACHLIIYEDLPVLYSEQTKLDAYTVLIDEYYHVYVAKNMMMQLDKYYPHRRKFNYPLSDSYHAVVQIKNILPNKYHAIFEILAVCIFETTLVRELVEFFNSPEVHPSIKFYVNDHMNDESRHYGYFYDLLAYTWANLPEDYQEHIGKQLALFVKLYLHVNSDKQFNLELLHSFFADKEKATHLVAQLYKGFDITPDLPIVKNVMQVLQKTAVLDHPLVKESFRSLGLA